MLKYTENNSPQDLSTSVEVDRDNQTVKVWLSGGRKVEFKLEKPLRDDEINSFREKKISKIKSGINKLIKDSFCDEL